MNELKQLLAKSKHMVFFGGAGVSTESQIPDFRSAAGLYSKSNSGYSPEYILSHTFFMSEPEKFYEFYRKKMIYQNAKPNAAHYALANLESQGRLDAVITQNIDGLHQKAGSKTVYELHGSVERNYCMSCNKRYPLEFIMNSTPSLPRCSCSGLVRPDVVLYEEALNSEVISQSINAIRRADVLIIGGTSLSVYPAAGLIEYFRGSKLVLINRDPTPYDHRADIVIHGSIGATLAEALN